MRIVVKVKYYCATDTQKARFYDSFSTKGTILKMESRANCFNFGAECSRCSTIWDQTQQLDKYGMTPHREGKKMLHGLIKERCALLILQKKWSILFLWGLLFLILQITPKFNLIISTRNNNLVYIPVNNWNRNLIRQVSLDNIKQPIYTDLQQHSSMFSQYLYLQHSKFETMFQLKQLYTNESAKQHNKTRYTER